MSVLDGILAATRVECERLRNAPPDVVAHAPIDVAARLRRTRGEPLRLITEIKLRSPSAGPLSRALSVDERARVYAREGATMISVLVDRAHFDGGYEHFARVRAATELPLLAKGFVVDEVQLDAARRCGADAVLLIVRILDRATLQRLMRATEARGLTPIVEVIDEPELALALEAGARVIGVNARDLATLEMDAARAARVQAAIPTDRVALFFSGLSKPDDVARIAATAGRAPDGALIGETLMRQDDPGPLLAAMVRAAAEVARDGRAG